MTNCTVETLPTPDQFEDAGVADSPKSHKPVDLVHLSKQTFGSKELENELLNLFLSHSQQCLIRLRNAETDTDWANAAHSIKGSARAIGAWAIGDRMEDFERLAATGTLADKTAAVGEIEDLITTTNLYISNLIKAA